VRAPPKPKPNTALETDRVLRIFDWISDELAARKRRAVDASGYPPPIFPRETPVTSDPMPAAILAVAERIAARTED
jgi:hypothetical protein